MQHYHFSRVDQVGIDQMGIDPVGIDPVGVDQMGINQNNDGLTRSNNKHFVPCNGCIFSGIC